MNFEMRVEPIIKKYLADEDDQYLLNFHKRYCSFDSFGANVNKDIRQVRKSMGIPKEKWYYVSTP